MSPMSPDRLEWVERRLFILARTVQATRRDGLRTTTRYIADSPNEAHAVWAQTLQDLNKERLALMMEREAIREYLQENDAVLGKAQE